MSASIELKKQQVEQIVEKIKASKSVVLVDYSGLTVKEDTELRSNFRKNGVEYRVLKNTLLKRAFNELGYTEFDNSLNGATAVAFGLEDAVAGAKTISEGTGGAPQAQRHLHPHRDRGGGTQRFCAGTARPSA